MLAQNCCANCIYEKTCGYSMLAMTGHRDLLWSFGPCVLGNKSNGQPFFEPREAAGTEIRANACICCGGDITVTYEDEMTQEFALAVDVCPACWKADCLGLSLVSDDEERYCNVLQAKSQPREGG